MQIETFDIEGPLLIISRAFEDNRGFFTEVFNARTLKKEAGIDLTFVQDNQSFSRDKGTVRGLHFQTPPHAQDKLVRVEQGAIFDVAVDLRRGSATYGRHVAVELSAKNRKQLWVPKGFAHGFCTLEPDTRVFYKVTDFYAPETDAGLIWNDPDLAIDWPVRTDQAVLSDKDLANPPFSNWHSPF